MSQQTYNLTPVEKLELQRCMMSSVRLKRLIGDMRIADFPVDKWDHNQCADVYAWILGRGAAGDPPAVIREAVDKYTSEVRHDWDQHELSWDQFHQLNALLDDFCAPTKIAQSRFRRFVLPDGRNMTLAVGLPAREVSETDRTCPTCSHLRHHAHRCEDLTCPCSTPMDK